MYAKTLLPVLALVLQALAAPAATTSVPDLEGIVVIPGFGQGEASISLGGVGSDGSTTLFAFPTPTASGAFASISGPVTLLSGPSGSSEAKFKLVDGSDVDGKCTIKGSEADCSANFVKDGTTSSTAFSTPLPTGFSQYGDLSGKGKSGALGQSGTGSMAMGAVAVGLAAAAGILL